MTKMPHDDQWILAHADELKAELLLLAEAGKPKPKPGTLLGRALALFTTPDTKGTIPMTDNTNSKLQSLLQAINDTCPMIEAEAAKIGKGTGDDDSIRYIGNLVAELAEAVSEVTGEAMPGYGEGYEDGHEEGRTEGYDEGYEEAQIEAEDDEAEG